MPAPPHCGRPKCLQADLLAVCREALKTPDLGKAEARLFFETHFQPFAVMPHSGNGFLTGYYEPEFQGSRTPDAAYRVPLLDRPEDLVTIPQGETLPGLDQGLQAARRTKDGYEPYPDRAAIEDGALGSLAKPIVYLREPGEAFIIHVQGSARIRLADGSVMRVAYAGRNGRPYTSIGRLLVQQGEMDLETMTLEKLMGWLKDHPEPAKALMRQNRSYIFFREASELAPEDGPIGGAGTPLVPGRSLAVDRSLWAYGLPVWLDGQLPLTLDTSRAPAAADDRAGYGLGHRRAGAGRFLLRQRRGGGTPGRPPAPRQSASWFCSPNPVHDQEPPHPPAQLRGEAALVPCGPAREAHEGQAPAARAGAGREAGHGPCPVDRLARPGTASSSAQKPALPPLAPVERKTLLALRRGRKDVDSVIDLHGMRQEEAHFALLRFLHRAQGSGHGLVLVITGKGGAAVEHGLFEERGVLRRMVPHWLRLPDLRSLVIGFEEASPQHGGSGALYVRLRRRRGAG